MLCTIPSLLLRRPPSCPLLNSCAQQVNTGSPICEAGRSSCWSHQGSCSLAGAGTVHGAPFVYVAAIDVTTRSSVYVCAEEGSPQRTFRGFGGQPRTRLSHFRLHLFSAAHSPFPFPPWPLPASSSRASALPQSVHLSSFVPCFSLPL